jgi:hypothetical protein
MENVRRAYGWRTWGDVGREAVLAIMLGELILIIESGGTGEAPDLHGFIRNGILGLSAFGLARGLETVLSWAIERSQYPMLFRSLIYAVGGWLGMYTGLFISGSVVGFEADDFATSGYHFVYSIAITASFSLLIGFVLHHNRKRNDRLREGEFAEKELTIARDMQRRLLPPEHIEHEGFRVDARTEPAYMVGGDFYDVVRLNDGAFAIVVADVSGKGIAAAMVMATCKAMIPFLASSGDAAAVIDSLNAQLCDRLERREFVAMLFARFDPRTGSLDIVNAGMPDPLLLGANGSMQSVTFEGDRMPLGARKASRYQSTRVTLEHGQRLFAFSDGFPEATVEGSPIGYDRVETMARELTSIDALFASVKRAKVEDDLTVVVLQRT